MSKWSEPAKLSLLFGWQKRWYEYACNIYGPRWANEYASEYYDRMAPFIASEIAAAKPAGDAAIRLDEAKWWRHLVIMKEQSYFAVEGDKRIAELERAAESFPSKSVERGKGE